MSGDGSNSRINSVDDLKIAANGLWTRILTGLGFPGDYIESGTIERDCPKCGGDTRWRTQNDYASTGGVRCNQCHSTNNQDGISAVRWWLGCDFQTACRRVCEQLGLDWTPGRSGSAKGGGQKPKADPEKDLKIAEWNAFPVSLWCKQKPGTSVRGVQLSGGKPGRYRDRLDVIAWPIVSLAGPAEKPVGFAIVDRSGAAIPTFGRGSDGKAKKTGEAKVKITAGSQHGLIGSNLATLFEHPEKMQRIWKVEGITDCVALAALVDPTTECVITTAFGTEEKPQQWMIDLIGRTGAAKGTHADGSGIIVIHDRDEPGDSGAAKWVRAISAVAADVRKIDLPYPLAESHGHDIRDWLTEDANRGLDDLVALAAQCKLSVPPDVGLACDSLATISPAVSSAYRPIPEPVGDDMLDWLSIFEPEGRSDLANAMRFAKHWQGRALYCPQWGKWLIWSGTHWERDRLLRIEAMAEITVRRMWVQLTECEDAGAQKSAATFILKSSNRESITKMVAQARNKMSITPEMLDSNTWLLNCANGTIDLRTGDLRSHNPADRITECCPTAYDPDASPDELTKFLDSIFASDDDLIEFVHRFFGYAITGETTEQILAIAWGGGSNGKSTLIDEIKSALGRDYAITAQPEMLMEKSHTGGHTTELMDLCGKRLVTFSETNDSKKLAESTVKSLTGGDAIRGRRMREDTWEYDPTHKLLLSTNHKPRVAGNDHGIWRRIRLIPFAQKFWDASKGESGPAHLEMDKRLPERLSNQREGTLAWLVDGCRKWQASGLNAPSAVIEATAEYRVEENPVARFIEECCDLKPSLSVGASDLYKKFRQWQEDDGVSRHMTQTKFGKLLTEFHGVRKEKCGNVFYTGVAIKSWADSVNEDRKYTTLDDDTINEINDLF
jgi:putative DNA primase/helicase